MEKHSILLADDHPIFRLGMRHALMRHFKDSDVTEAGSFTEALNIASTSLQSYTMFILDLMMPGFEPNSGVALLRQQFPETTLIILSMTESTLAIESVMAAGAHGFVSKTLSAQKIIDTIKEISSGTTLVQQAASSISSKAPMLSPRQKEVLLLLQQGLSNNEIGEHLGISTYTARMHVSGVLRALSVNSRTEAVAVANKLHLFL